MDYAAVYSPNEMVNHNSKRDDLIVHSTAGDAI